MDQTTRGLVDRPWPARPQRLLRCFRLLLCRFLLDRTDAMRAGLNTGPRRFDDLPTLACKMFTQLQCSWESHDERVKVRTRAGAGLSAPGGPPAAAADEAADFALIGTLLVPITRFPAGRLALAARGLYEWRAAAGQPERWVPNRDAIRKYARTGSCRTSPAPPGGRPMTPAPATTGRWRSSSAGTRPGTSSTS